MPVSGHKLQAHSTPLRKAYSDLPRDDAAFCLLAVASVENLEPAVLVHCVHPLFQDKTMQFAFASACSFYCLYYSCMFFEVSFCRDVLRVLFLSPTYPPPGGSRPCLGRFPIVNADQACIVMGQWSRVMRSR